MAVFSFPKKLFSPFKTLAQSLHFLIWVILGFILTAAILSAAYFFWQWFNASSSPFLSPLGSPTHSPKPLDPYTFTNLSRRLYPGSTIQLEKTLKEEENFTSYLFSYLSDDKRITGMANLPNQGENLPIIILIRGFVDEKYYRTGVGTEKAASHYAQHGFITLAPDFLGFGGSDPELNDILEARFRRPIDIFNLIASVPSLPQANHEKIALWGHSNGGQIALSVLEISQKNYPTSLWAPVSINFPQSVYHFLDETEPLGLEVKQKLEAFEKIYDPQEYSITAYLDKIQAPLIIHQGLRDEYIPDQWQKDLVQRLKKLEKDFTYYTYPDENHNFTKTHAEKLKKRDLEFFQKHLP